MESRARQWVHAPEAAWGQVLLSPTLLPIYPQACWASAPQRAGEGLRLDPSPGLQLGLGVGPTH